MSQSLQARIHSAQAAALTLIEHTLTAATKALAQPDTPPTTLREARLAATAAAKTLDILARTAPPSPPLPPPVPPSAHQRQPLEAPPQAGQAAPGSPFHSTPSPLHDLAAPLPPPLTRPIRRTAAAILARAGSLAPSGP